MKCYFVHDKNNETGQAIIADNLKESIKIALNILDCDYIDIRSKIIKNVNIAGLGKGLVDYIEALKRKFFDYVSDCDCPACGKKYTTIHRDYHNENNIVCVSCES